MRKPSWRVVATEDAGDRMVALQRAVEARAELAALGVDHRRSVAPLDERAGCAVDQLPQQPGPIPLVVPAEALLGGRGHRQSSMYEYVIGQVGTSSSSQWWGAETGWPAFRSHRTTRVSCSQVSRSGLPQR